LRGLWLLLLAVGCDDPDGDGFAGPQDCAKNDPSIFPGAPEVCNGADDDCDGAVDEEAGPMAYPDADADGFGDGGAGVMACALPSGHVAEGGDCNDADPSIHPGAEETCDGIDQDCDLVPDDSPSQPLFEDLDGDDYGNPDRPLANCDAWAADNDDDCDDADPDRNPSIVEVCNGIDDDCDDLTDDADPNVVASDWYTDADGDGSGVGKIVHTGCTSPIPDTAPADGDCDDADPTRHPNAPELCNGRDDDCDLGLEGADAWAFAGLEVRVPIEVTPPVGPAGPWTFDLDARAALDAVGATEAFDPSTVRAAVHDCGGGYGTTELPATFLDHQEGLFVLGSDGSAIGDESGAVVVLWDLDGDAATVEPAPVGPVEIGIYFQGTAPDPTFVSDLTATSDLLEAGGATATFDAAAGGLLATLELPGSPLLASQTDAERGNGVRTLTAPLSAQDVNGALVLLDASPVTAAVFTEGHLDNASGATDFTYTYRVFAGRPELWITPSFFTTEATSITGDPDRTAVMRPFQSVWDLAGATCSTDSGLLWADASTGDWGLTWAWAVPSAFVTHLECTDLETWSAANDYKPCCYGSTGTISTLTSWIDHPVMVLLPHEGGIENVEEIREARLSLPLLVQGAAETP
jgi:hypothetical protein